jgi:hypothetical protein
MPSTSRHSPSPSFLCCFGVGSKRQQQQRQQQDFPRAAENHNGTRIPPSVPQQEGKKQELASPSMSPRLQWMCSIEPHQSAAKQGSRSSDCYNNKNKQHDQPAGHYHFPSASTSDHSFVHTPSPPCTPPLSNIAASPFGRASHLARQISNDDQPEQGNAVASKEIAGSRQSSESRHSRGMREVTLAMRRSGPGYQPSAPRRRQSQVGCSR